jgi:hemerythrin-like metal-binding protein
MTEIAGSISIASINHPGLDATHRHLAEFAQQLESTNTEGFPARFLSLLGQLEEHFVHEEYLMEQSGFRHTAEHKEDHRQMLQEMRQLLQRRQPFARAYISERLPERLNLHITRMDSMLALALNQS